jgi:hypothetical protein
MKLQTIQALQSTLVSLKSIPMPLRLSYKFSKLLSKIEEDNEFFITKTREIIMKYAEKNEKGNVIQNEGNVHILPENITIANEELDELNNIEMEDIYITFTLEELESLSIAPEALQPLLPFIIDDEQ